jgi:hypothetical protein
VEGTPQVENIPVVLYTKLQNAADLEERDRHGYEADPQRDEEFRVWEAAAAWPATK